MGTKQDYNNNCFSPNWLEVDLEDIRNRQTERSASKDEIYSVDVKKEVSLESNRRKDLNTLLRELDEIKHNIEKVAEKQHRLANLMGFYSGEFAQ